MPAELATTYVSFTSYLTKSYLKGITAAGLALFKQTSQQVQDARK
jgi:hypothetical protein